MNSYSKNQKNGSKPVNNLTQSNKTNKTDCVNDVICVPARDGMYMPAEFSEQDGVILIWPVRPGSWGVDPSDAQEAFLSIIQVLSEHEKVYLLADNTHFEEASKRAGQYAEVLAIESDDAWARDVGPTFVTDGHNVRGVSFQFNAWGGEVDGLYASWKKDNRVAKSFCRKTGYACYDCEDFVLEGGSVHSDGEGTLLVTESCLLSAGRNPKLSREQIEERLKETLGAKKVLWLPHGIYLDETNEHVDNVCAWVNPGEVVLAWTDREDDPQFEMSKKDLEYLQGEKDARGRSIVIHKLPIPDHPICVDEEACAGYDFEDGEDVREPGDRLAASYVNFYIGNGVVLVPQFGGENAESDKRAQDILQELFPDRKVCGIDSLAILLGGGNIHCITQQIPKGERG